MWSQMKKEVDEWLDQYLPPEDRTPEIIHKSMRYSVFAGGKRLRAILFLAVADALGWSHPQRYAPACAIELIHTYSLIHDDLPAMDDDDFRRGQPTNHKVFGQAMAILAGDALLTHAFYLLSRYPEGNEFSVLRCRVGEEIARAAGAPHGMVAGQALDISSTGKEPGKKLLHDIHRLKTGAMIRVSLRSGAILGGATNDVLNALTKYGDALGLAFQITDDILDVTASRQELGKTPGKDTQQGKTTFPAVYGLEKSRSMASETISQAIDAIQSVESSIQIAFLTDIAHFVLKRGH